MWARLTPVFHAIQSPHLPWGSAPGAGHRRPAPEYRWARHTPAGPDGTALSPPPPGQGSCLWSQPDTSLDQTELSCRPLHLIRVLVWTEPKTLLDQGKLRSGLFYLIRVLVFEVKQTRCEKQLPAPRSVKTKRLIFASVTLFHRELRMSLYHM